MDGTISGFDRGRVVSSESSVVEMGCLSLLARVRFRLACATRIASIKDNESHCEHEMASVSLGNKDKTRDSWLSH